MEEQTREEQKDRARYSLTVRATAEEHRKISMLSGKYNIPIGRLLIDAACTAKVTAPAQLAIVSTVQAEKDSLAKRIDEVIEELGELREEIILYGGNLKKVLSEGNVSEERIIEAEEAIQQILYCAHNMEDYLASEAEIRDLYKDAR